jgi:hypothetical protein
MQTVAASIGVFCSLLMVVTLSTEEMHGNLKLLIVVLLAIIDVYILMTLKPGKMKVEKPCVE